MDQMRCGELIAALRKEKGLTQKELGARLGISDRAVSNWERGIRFPDIALLEELSDILEVSILELLRGERMEREIGNAEMEQTVKEALQVQKKELNRNWMKIVIICVLCAVMLCLGFRYAFFMDRVLLINLINLPHLWIRIVIPAIIGGVFRYAVGKGKNFYSAALGVLVLWFLCETVSAVIFQYDIVSQIALAGAATSAGWFLLWGMAGAWLLHGILWLKERVKK